MSPHRARRTRFRMGSDRHYPEEAPAHAARRSTASGSTATPVTNREFRAFVEATGHVTFAEIAPDPKDYPGALPHMLKAGSLVFSAARASGRPARLDAVVDVRVRRRLAHPYGPDSSIDGLDDHPGRARRLPRRRGLRRVGGQGAADRGRVGVRRARRPRRRRVRLGRRVHARRAARWPTPGRARFPHAEPAADGFERTSPVGAFPPNGYGLLDMIGNVWEWTTDWYAEHAAAAAQACCMPRNPRGGGEARATTRASREIRIPRKVLKGGSHLCAPNYCRRYRPAARHAAAGRHLDLSRRLPLRRARREAEPRIDMARDRTDREAPTTPRSSCRRGAPACRSSARA